MPFEMTQIKELMERYTWPKAIAVTGALGSGKTEWVLNLALGLKTLEEQVTIADADIINPYFCIRQVVNSLEEKDHIKTIQIVCIDPLNNGEWIANIKDNEELQDAIFGGMMSEMKALAAE